MAADRATEARQDWPLETCQCVICPDCAFTFDATHVTQATGEYECPACSERRLLDERERLTEAARYALDCIESPDVEYAPGKDIYDAHMMRGAICRLRAALSAVSERKPA